MKTGILKNRKLLIVAAIILSVIQSCVKDNFNLNKLSKTEWDPNIAVPLVYSSLSVKDLLIKNNATTSITVDDSNFCTLVYKSSLLSIRADSLIQLPDQPFPTYSGSLTPAQITILSAAHTVTASYSQTVTFNTGSNNPLIDSVGFNNGNLNISLNSDFTYSGQLVITIPTAKKNGVPFSQTLPFTYSGTTPVIAAASYNLAGYKVDMTMGGTTSNQFVVNYTMTLNGAGTALPTDQMTLNGSMGSLKFDKIFGYIGQLTLFPKGLDTIAITIFKNSLGTGSFSIANPSVKITILNSYGVPIQGNIPTLEGYNPPATNFPITGVPSPVPILSPNFSQIGQTLADSFSLDKSNSNIATVVNNDPKFLISNVTAMTNPGGPTHTNFVLDSSHCKVNIEADLPLYGTASNFSLIDTAQLSMASVNTNNIQWALFRIYTSNGFPMDVNVQAYFVDSLYKKLDSLIIPNQLILKSGVLNAAGMVIAPTVNIYNTTLTPQRLANLKTTKYMLIKSVEATTNNGTTNVKIYSTYKIDVKIGMEVKLKTTI
jgi:hypothetical protein